MEQRNLLIVDEGKLFPIVGISYLKRDSFNFDTAHSGPEALEKARLTKPDLILLDYEMKDMNGGEVCRILQSVPDTRHIPVIIFGSPSSEGARGNCLDAGCRAFLLKPIRRDDLIRVVEEVLSESQRHFVRIPVNIPVALSISGNKYDAVVLTLSIAGAFIAMDDPPEPGTQLEIHFTNPELSPEKQILAEVVWIGKESKQDALGAGVRFLEIDYLERELFTRYVMNRLQQSKA